MDNLSVKTDTKYMSGLPSGKAPATFGCWPGRKGNLRMTDGSKLAPRVHLSVQCLVRTYFRINKVIAVRLAKSVHGVPARKRADGRAPIHDYSDANPGSHYYESNSTGLDIYNITGSARSRIIPCFTTSKLGLSFDEDLAELQDAEDRPPGDERRDPPQAEIPAAPSSADDNRLSTIPEEDEDAEMMLGGRACE